ncbi:MAG: thiamine phosphate synthase [Candidatus Krumholzibacteria bacterium]|nr:thiamine phosphate synthase [Candidatus Krumholzibacteria bacterium]
MPSIDFRFYLVTDRERCAPRSLLAVVREACDAGVRAVQLREKDLSRHELEDYVARIAEISTGRGAKLIVNRSRPLEGTEETFLAASMGVSGFHFPDSAPFPLELRERFPKILVGMSTHSRERAVAAATEGADFITFGPVFATPSKAQYGPPQGIDALREVCTAARVPVFAVGGVTPENTRACIDAGAHGVAVIGAVMNADDITDVMRSFRRALGSL